ncbi:MAG: decaprenyl-phosphate phosphoribosyltransferase [Piscirickettsiaceae bacterium CG_4_9_14_3_um_filter_43_564]|nr:decaprenyl-phosphate phosphoribosyltransferase [Thiomicrospira sp.]OIP94476.1 MAG: prenyltransferase [Thiomicrospira sp. CG2_30_44_34]PIQ04435.1 MAG: decaprenyl-phosphate phosphoribosyltransferase [Piscirickettsiaceae bacterium CG18_big_fil_WC_8_21_14_2_50_44_103]PJA66600.1 MAG: decaprenyl-phosphate phosphoribosyltransferase [Piscirickettsiaceae bacterium CG_4_9_14_3_um_filter_43_564]NCO14671.1 decaprenyl-phosphate phosphoribosyltransferase [Thiomicrospira sp.]
MNDLIKLMRPHQYVKNLFVLAPIFFAGAILQENALINGLIAFVLFSITASAIYVLNDLKDIQEDRAHPTKCNRPIASGRISITQAWLLFIGLASIGLLGSFWLSEVLFYIVTTYILLNIFYSLGLKHVSILDISIISFGFVLRVLAGAAVIETPPSMWIILITFLLALFLALAKRRDDVLLSTQGLKTRKNIDGYNLEFVNAAMVIMSSVVIVAYIFYTISDTVQARLGTDYLYLTVIFVIVGIMRYMQITFVENDSGSPTKVVLKDKFLKITIGLWALAFGLIIYTNG